MPPTINDSTHPQGPNVTGLLHLARDGDAAARERLFTLVYDELHGMAGRHMRGQGPGHTLQTTALVNECFVRLTRGGEKQWSDRHQFLAVAGSAMRTVLVDHARAKGRMKRRSPGGRVPLEEIVASYEQRSLDLLALDEALNRLSQLDPDMVRLVELRFFAGLGMEEAAEILGQALRSAERNWQMARAWLRRELQCP